MPYFKNCFQHEWTISYLFVYHLKGNNCATIFRSTKLSFPWSLLTLIPITNSNLDQIWQNLNNDLPYYQWLCRYEMRIWVSFRFYILTIYCWACWYSVVHSEVNKYNVKSALEYEIIIFQRTSSPSFRAKLGSLCWSSMCTALHYSGVDVTSIQEENFNIIDSIAKKNTGNINDHRNESSSTIKYYSTVVEPLPFK